MWNTEIGLPYNAMLRSNDSFGLPAAASQRRRALILGACLGMTLTGLEADGQQALQNMLTTDNYQAARQEAQMLPQTYTYRAGDFRLLTVASLELDWNDNVTLLQDDKLDDFIVTPLLQSTAFYPLTDQNVLGFTGGIGYAEYIKNSQLSGLRVQAGTGPSFDVSIKDFAFNIHDYVSYVQDPSQQPLVTGTAEYGSLDNTSGIRATWNAGVLVPTIGYDHVYTTSTTGQYESEDAQSDLVFSRIGYQIDPRLSAGLELSASFQRYAQEILNNNESYSVGVFGNWRPDNALQVRADAGYDLSQFQNTSQSVLVPEYGFFGNTPVAVPTSAPIRTSDFSSWYANVTVSHRITQAISYGIVAGHQIEAGIESDAVEDWYVRPSLNWLATRDIAVNFGLSYDHGDQGVGNIEGNLSEIYDWINANVSVNYNLTRKVNLALNYRLTLRGSSIPGDGYTQNMVGIIFTYRPS